MNTAEVLRRKAQWMHETGERPKRVYVSPEIAHHVAIVAGPRVEFTEDQVARSLFGMDWFEEIDLPPSGVRFE